ncbi:hypothetical protein SHKM778_94890 (plasmid) [Streptomyces sp. KM77-8]|uniref:Asparagine synthetase domain-containing protein n=1 Tax=Streptomyces haneummycinicus TaxID=3074435 RepID=A0AAT9I0A6_9ACTN
MPGVEAAWTAGWPTRRVRSVSDGPVSLAVIGDCGADDDQLAARFPAVRAGRWRELTRWPGSYLAVARNGPTLAVLGDLAGQHPVYWRSHGGTVWWATSALALAALDGAPVDPTALAAHLALAQPDVLGQRSLMRCVNRVPGGHLLLADPTGARTVRFEPAAYESVDLPVAAATVRAALGEAVATCLDGRPVSADLAGLDSTTLACLAAQRGPVSAVTFADERLRDDDLPYATRTAAAVPNLAHHAVPGTAHTVYYDGLDDLSTLPLTDAPNAYAVTASIKRAVLDTVAAHHPAPGLHLTGSAGDAVLSAPPPTSPTCCGKGSTAGPGPTRSATPDCGTPPPGQCSGGPAPPPVPVLPAHGGRQPPNCAAPYGSGCRRRPVRCHGRRCWPRPTG